MAENTGGRNGGGDDTVPTEAAPGDSGNVIAITDGQPGFGVVKLRGLSAQGEPTATDVVIGRAGFNNHSPSLSGQNIAWIESPAGSDAGIGRIMLQNHALSAANDNPGWAVDHHGAGIIGGDPTIADLMSGDTLLTWVGADGNAHACLYPPSQEGHGPGSRADAPEYAAVNASLADLGPIVATPDNGRRLQVTETKPGSFALMWLALAESTPVLRGGIFTVPANGDGNDDPASHGAGVPIADIHLPPAFTGQFALGAASDGSADVVVSYLQADADTGGTVTLARHIGLASDGKAGLAGPEFPVFAAPDAGDRTATVSPAGDLHARALIHGGDTVAETHALQVGAGTPALMPSLTLGSGTPAPAIVRETQGGFVAVWETAGASADAVTIRIAMFDAGGAVRSLSDGTTVVTVTDHADATVAAAITGVGAGAAVGFVDADGGKLVVKAYGGGGDQIGNDAIVDDAAAGAIREVTLGSHHGEGSDNVDIAVVYVRDDHDDQPDYGSIMLQRYQIWSSHIGPPELIALGGDGAQDGNDAPVQLTSERDGDPSTLDPALGRAPTITELTDGDLAIVWVENDGARETMRGSVIEANGHQVLHIDLTGLLDAGGIAKGTKPTLLATHSSDIVVSWLQPDGDHGYVVMAAFYRSAGDNAWVEPDAPIRLRTFEDEPKDFSVTLSDGDSPAINVFWRTDSSGSGGGDVLSQRFDLDGNDLGRTRAVASNDSHDLPQDSTSAASLIDGQIVVLYTEEKSNGGVDLAAHVIDARSDGGMSASELAGLPVDASDSSAAAAAPAAMPDAAAPVTDGASHAALPADAAFATSVDQEIAIDVASPWGGGTAAAFINGKPITIAQPVDVGHGWVQLREDGQLTVSPDKAYAGDIKFDYSVGDAAGQPGAATHVVVNVEPEPVSGALALKNPLTQLAEDASTSSDIKLAEITDSSGHAAFGNFALLGLDAEMFKIVDTTLYLKAGVELDFETKPSLSVEIRINAATDGDSTINFTLGVEDKHESNGSHGDAASAGDTFVFAPGFDGDAAGNAVHEVIDVSSSGFRTFQELLDSGALVQSGDDVVLTFDPADPAHSDRVTLRGVDLSVLTGADFKF